MPRWPSVCGGTLDSIQLSAIIPTHDRPLALRQCLESLQAQAVERSRLEVIVVDDGSQTDVATVVRTVAAQGPIVMRCECQPLSGLNSARNRGAAVAGGEVLAFLDDDTIVAIGWAAALATAFEAHPCAAVGGRVVLGLDGPAPDWLAPRRYYLAEYDLGSEPRWIEDEDPAPVGANCAVRRSAFERIGGFSPGLDRIGTSLVSNGDTEFFHRLRSTGAMLRYEPAASVVHCVPDDRLTVSFFLKRHYAQGVSDELLLAMQEGGSTLRRRAILVRWLVRNFARGARVLWKDIRGGRGTVMARFAVCYWAGRLRGAEMRVPSVIPGRDEFTRTPPGERSPTAPSPP